MTRWLAVALALAACSKKHDDKPAPPADKPMPVAPAPTGASSLAVKDGPVPEFSGSYDKVLAQIDAQAKHTTLAFVRGCPALTCDPGAWEIEQIAHVCPKAYLATFDIPTDEVTTTDGKKLHADLHLSGPADQASTGTIEHVRLEISHLDHDAVIGIAHHETTDSSVDGTFHAEVCPRT